jgi:hypothetical protein
MASFRLNQDVFGASTADYDIWVDSPEKSQKPKFSLKVEQERRSINSKHTAEEFDEKKNTSSKSTRPKDEKRKSNSKRSSTSGSTKSRKERTTAAEEVAPVLAPLASVDAVLKTRTSRPKKPLHQKRNDPLSAEDGPDFLVQRLKKERKERVAQPQEPQKHKTTEAEDDLDFLVQMLKKEKKVRVAQPQEPRKHNTTEAGISIEPKRFTVALLRSEAGSNIKKSYLPRTSASSSGNRRSEARRESVAASLNKFLSESARSDLPPKAALRSVHSTPEEDPKTKKVRPSRRRTSCGGSSSDRKSKNKSGILENHLQSTGPRHRQDGVHRSVASAPAAASRNKDLFTKCQALKLAF